MARDTPTCAEEFLSRCWVPVIYLKSRFFYAYGNTVMEDLLEDFEVSETCDVLLLGAGDIRHVLKTVAGFSSRPQSACQTRNLRFHLDDTDGDVIARDIVLLEVIDSIDADKPADIDYLWDVWYNMTLTEEHYKRLRVTLKRLVEGASSLVWRFGDEATKSQVFVAWKDWLDGRPWGVRKVRENRRAYLEFYHNYNLQKAGVAITGKNVALGLNHASFWRNYGFSQHDLDNSKEKYEKELQKAWDAGDIRRSSGRQLKNPFVNPTMMRPGSDKWHVHYGSSPFLSYIPFESKQHLAKFDSLTAACLATLQTVVKEYATMRRKIELSVTFWSRDAFELCHYTLPSETKFDLIHTSNIQDHVTLLSLLVVCQPRLKNFNSVLVTDTMLWNAHHNSIEDYLSKSLRCPFLMLPTVLGLRLAEDLDLGMSCFRCFENATPESIRWVKCVDEQSVPVHLQGSQKLVEFLMALVKACFPEHTMSSMRIDVDDIAMSPLVLIFVIRRLQKFVIGGLTELLTFVDTNITSHGNLTHVTTWKTLCRSFGFRKDLDQILMIHLPFKCGFPRHPDQSAIGFSPPAFVGLTRFPGALDDEFLMTALMAGIPGLSIDTIDVFRVYYFDPSDESFYIPILRSVWENLAPSCSWFLCTSQTFFKDESRCSCSHRDASVVATFVDIKDQVQDDSKLAPFSVVGMMALSCNEFEDRYEVEMNIENKEQKVKLEVVDSVPSDNLAKTKVHLTVTSIDPSAAFRCDVTWQFSCCLLLSMSKFQTSSRSGFVRASLIKEAAHYNVGLSTLPWRQIDDGKLVPFGSDAEIERYFQTCRVTAMQFASERDNELLLRAAAAANYAAITDPFYCLRETIARICDNFKMKTIALRYKEDETLQDTSLPVLELQTTGYYLYRGLPFIKVTCIDSPQVRNLVDDGLLPESVVNAKRVELADGDPFMLNVLVSESELQLVRRLLMVNRRRVRQDGASLADDGWYWNSYIQPLFDRKPLRAGHVAEQFQSLSLQRTINQMTRTSYVPSPVPRNGVRPTNRVSGQQEARSESDGKSHQETQLPSCRQCRKTGVVLLSCSRCQSVVYCSKECQKLDWKTHKPNCKVQPQEQAQPPSCFHCHSAGVERKKCTRCHMVSYCGRECQRLDWEKHKPNCK